MRFKSPTVQGVQVFAVAGTNTVSFGIRATASARAGLLGFGVKRIDGVTGKGRWVNGYKVFRSVIPNPTPKTYVSTYRHPIQSLVYDDFTAQPDHPYDYEFHPFRGTPQTLDRTAPPVIISVRTEPLTGGKHDVFFNRGVTGSQTYARRFGNKAPDKQPTAKKQADAFAWLSRDLDEAIIDFIDSAKKGDAIRACFYEFHFPPVLRALKRAHDKGVDVKVIVDQKVNEKTIKPTPANKLKKPKFQASFPRVANLEAIEAARLPKKTIVAREARKDDIQHNKFIVLLRGKTARKAVEVWTGSTNLSDGGFFGQANVGHRVRDEKTAALFLKYWELLESDPGAPTNATKDPLNIAFLKDVDKLSPAPKSVSAIKKGVTPLFSPRGHLGPLDLYVELLAGAKSFSCGTFAFGIPRPFREAINATGSGGPLCFLLLEKKDVPKPTKANPTVIFLNSKNNTYKASGSELHTTIGRWVAETNNKKVGLNVHVAYIHLKFMLHDPLGPDPIVVTGSANFSDASTKENDENMLVIRGDRRVADIYFTEFGRLWGHYQYRSVVEATAKQKPKPGAPTPHNYQDLFENTDWQKDYEPGDLRSKRVDQFVNMAI
jgi:phosphatidylserine/phosphatidylglycerophosphate/cardiolipin synthase-like enzyme